MRGLGAVRLITFIGLSTLAESKVFWNPGDRIFRHNTEFSRAQEALASQGVVLERVEAPPRLEDEILYVQNRYAKPDAIHRLDIFRTEASWLRAMEYSLYDLKQFLTPQEIAMFDSRAVEALTVNGKLLALPSFFDFSLLYYRKDLLSEYGFNEPPKTWDDLEMMADTVQKGERAKRCPGDTCFWGLMWQASPNEILTVITLSVISSHGGGAFIDAGGQVNINNPNALGALKRMKEWIGWLSPPSIVSQHLHETKVDFLLENALFLIDLTHIIGEIHGWRPEGCTVFQCSERDFAQRTSYTHLPGAPQYEDRRTNPWIFGWAVNRFSPDMEQVATVLRFLGSRGQQLFKARNGDMPTLYSVQDEVKTTVCPNVTDPDVCTVPPEQMVLVERNLEVIGGNYFDLGLRDDALGFSPLIFNGVHDYLSDPGKKAETLVAEWTCKMVFLFKDSLEGCEPCPEGLSRSREHPDAECIPDESSDGYVVLLLAIGLPLLALSVLGCWAVMYYMHRMSDAQWMIDEADLEFADPPVVVGNGTFGAVLQAEYRGTIVTVKPMIPTTSAVQNAEVVGPASKGGLAASFASTNWVTTHFGGSMTSRRSLGGGGSVTGGDSPSESSALERVGSGVERAGSSGGGPTTSLSSRSPEGRFVRSQSALYRRHCDEALHEILVDEARSDTEIWDSTVEDQEHLVFCCSNISSRRQSIKNKFVEEMRILTIMRHPCITTVMGAVIKKDNSWLVMEYMENGSLYDIIHNKTVAIEASLILPILQDVVNGLQYLHSAKPTIVHGDVKAQNVLVDERFRAKVTDFGLNIRKRRGRNKPKGSPLWMAPELLLGQMNTCASDVYSFGILVSEVYSRQEPYHGMLTQDVLRAVMDLDRDEEMRPEIDPGCPIEIVGVMKDCWHKDPELRPPVNEISRRIRALDTEKSGIMPRNSSFLQRRSAKESELLYDVFPQHIADALREGREVQPEKKDMVTIFFSDIVNFTTISSTLEPEKVSDMLHRLYTGFDQLSRDHGVFKVETIGDAYMGVCNLIDDQESDHAVRIAKFAQAAVKTAEETPIDLDDRSHGYVRIRVGFHSGPVVANVVGTRNLRYCLFGDTVNMASRMESTSVEGHIQCSATAARILESQKEELKAQISVRSRGKIQIKGKGEQHTFWVGEVKEDVLQRSASQVARPASPGSFRPGALPTIPASPTGPGPTLISDRTSSGISVSNVEPKFKVGQSPEKRRRSSAEGRALYRSDAQPLSPSASARAKSMLHGFKLPEALSALGRKASNHSNPSISRTQSVQSGISKESSIDCLQSFDAPANQPSDQLNG